MGANPTRGLDLVICDLILPDLPGDMLVEQIREQRHEAKVIFMSGQQGAADLILPPPPGVAPPVCLEKPFSLNQLAAAVAETLEPPSPERLTASQVQVRFFSRCRFVSTIVIITIIA